MLEQLVVTTVDWQSDWRAWLGKRGTASASTIGSYQCDLNVFAKWFEAENGQVLTPESITGVDLREFRRWSLEEQQVKPKTWNRRKVSLALVCQWAQAQGYLTYDPSDGLQGAEEQEPAPKWITDVEYNRLMRAVERATQTAQSDFQRGLALETQALVRLMADAGLRVAEACALNWGDVTIGERKGRVVVRLGKGAKRREVPLNAEVCRALKLWKTDSVGPNRSGVTGAPDLRDLPVFPGESAGRLASRTVGRRMNELGDEAKVEGGLWAHRLRHRFGKHLVDQGAPLTTVAKLMGHSRLEVTRLYVTPGWEDLERAVGIRD